MLKSATLVLLMTQTFARPNLYSSHWEDAAPRCEVERDCSGQGQCGEREVCRSIRSFERCTSIWTGDFCDRTCEDGLVLSPARYCKCITPAEYEKLFCEVLAETDPDTAAESESDDEAQFETDSDQCTCTREFAPVQCENGVIYNNSCLAECAGQFDCQEKSNEATRTIQDFQSRSRADTSSSEIYGGRATYRRILNDFSSAQDNRPTSSRLVFNFER